VGRGVARQLSWKPEVVDCGYVPPGLLASRRVTFTNSGSEAVELTGLATSPSEFLATNDGVALTRLTVGPHASAEATVVCRPLSLGPVEGSLSFETSLELQPTESIPLQVIGGGPLVEVVPTSLALGRVGFTEAATPAVYQTRTVVVRNAGFPPAQPDPPR